MSWPHVHPSESVSYHTMSQKYGDIQQHSVLIIIGLPAYSNVEFCKQFLQFALAHSNLMASHQKLDDLSMCEPFFNVVVKNISEKWIVHAVLWNVRSLILPFLLLHCEILYVCVIYQRGRFTAKRLYLHQRNFIRCTAIIWSRETLFDAEKLYLMQRNFICDRETFLMQSNFIRRI